MSSQATSQLVVGHHPGSDSGKTLETSMPAEVMNQKLVMLEEIRAIHIHSSGGSSTEAKNEADDAGTRVAQPDAIANRVSRRIGWVKAAILMVAETMSLGIMSLPQAMNSLGMIVGAILICFCGVLSVLSGLLLWKVKLKVPEVASYCDIMNKMYGRKGTWMSTTNNGTILILVMAAHIITWTEMVDVLSNGNTPCLVYIKAAGAFGMASLSLPKLLRSSMPLYYVAAGSIVTASFILIIGGGLTYEDLGAKSAFLIVPLRLLKFSAVASNISNVMISYAGHVAYFQIMDEMKNVNDFWKSLCLANGVIGMMYFLIAVVGYKFFGQDVASPALSSASPMIRKWAWGISIPTIIVAGVIAAFILNHDILELIWSKEQLSHDEAKTTSIPNIVDEEKDATGNQTNIQLQNSVNSSSMLSYKNEWIGRVLINAATWIAAFVLSNVIPDFGNLMGLMGSLVGWTIAIGQPALFWLWTEWNPVKSESNNKVLWKESIQRSYFHHYSTAFWLCFCVCMLVIWPVAAVTGVYGSGVLIQEAHAKNGAFSCNTISLMR
ncbi:uncharacterized protein RCC_10377 [Ramularia collo-cygni]|uniref:Amino acid transporter transmembrane domain-containing protein n=1 Tax=Ramularia collo-cygni TaxID=112498 RepID=A0A2D3VH83_9PEZI|nr:uncharacterized protein RCC_10377 [Ramularia collo-cygni]CZT24652.1 uncharacterized protein RCC_10377 [Ramularia collo-cygni]